MSSIPRSIGPVCPVTLSVVIPCYNEEATLARCVERAGRAF